jgi:transposase
MELHTIGIDLGKTVFHLVGLDLRGEVVVRKKFSRTQLLRFTANVHVGLIGMEACGGSHFLGRALREQRHEVRLIPAQYVKPYVKTNKSDYIDAEAIAEAVARPTMRFVPIKTDDQLDMQSLHRVRERWVMRRTAVINQIRGLLLERGITLRKGRHHVHAALPLILEDADAKLSGAVRLLLTQLKLDLDQLSVRIDEADAVIQKTAHENEACRRLVAIPASDQSRPPHSSRRSATEGPSTRGGSSQRGWGWFRANTPPVASRSCWVSANVGTLTCEDCSCKAHVRSCNNARSSLPV